LLSVEKERRTFGALCLLEGSSDRVVLKKLGAAFTVAGVLFAAPILLFLGLGLAGAHVDAIETALALAGEGLHATLVAAVSIAAAAWTRTLAQAATIGILVSLLSWAIEAAEGFAALAWLGGASAWSVERQLEPFQRGIVSVGSFAWLFAASAGAVVLSLIGARFDVAPIRRIGLAAVTIATTALLLFAASSSRRAYDWSEQRRGSLPPAAVDALRRIAEPLALDVFLDRDDSRRRQLESDVLAKLYLARPDLVVRTPLDDRATVAEGVHDADYGQIVVHVGSVSKRTRSTSRRELVTLIFEAAGRALPDWSMPPYPGFPFVAEGARRTVLLGIAYLVVPLGLLFAGVLLTRRRSVR
jgi:hypothetical protein